MVASPDSTRRVRSLGDAGGGSDYDGYRWRWLSPMGLLRFAHSTVEKEDDATAALTTPSVVANDVNGHSGDERGTCSGCSYCLHL
ncbi:hypothetical protein DEO72_LG6g393 [Vigna unguiculata]|uniref:Uncharacterized protein n=1 Tax=Vigna unguiculata TaxID=3917 RepID=A0A4D6M531_VIGUN|nr:hypothetical protein DEO72_LG6g393 [Vigna unguiculata]